MNGESSAPASDTTRSKIVEDNSKINRLDNLQEMIQSRLCSGKSIPFQVWFDLQGA